MSKKNIYAGKEMIDAGRFSRFYQTLSKDEQTSLIARIDTLVKENPEYCDGGNYEHLCNLFTALALYQIFQEEGKDKEDALKEVAEAMWDFVENGTAKTYRKVFKMPGVLWLLGKLMPTMFAKGSGYGWEYVWHPDTSTSKRVQFECTKCIYAQIFQKYDAMELGPAFCHCDVINYGHIDGISFERKHTLCTDGQACDFLFLKK